MRRVTVGDLASLWVVTRSELWRAPKHQHWQIVEADLSRYFEQHSACRTEEKGSSQGRRSSLLHPTNETSHVEITECFLFVPEISQIHLIFDP
jgi:hypothetical protein